MYADPGILSPIQQMVLTLLSTGSSMSAAAETAGIHRNTISNWRRSSTAFLAAWIDMQREQALHWRDELQALAKTAIETLRQLMVNTNSPASVRLRAALAIIGSVTHIAPPRKLHKLAQFCTTGPAAAPSQHPESGEDIPADGPNASNMSF